MKRLITEYEKLIDRLYNACEWLRINNIYSIEDVKDKFPARYKSYNNLIREIEDIQKKIKGKTHEI